MPFVNVGDAGNVWEDEMPHGDHWHHVSSPAEIIASTVRSMRGMVAMLDGTDEDYDGAYAEADAFALEVSYDVRRYFGQSDSNYVRNVRFVLGTGGPHVEFIARLNQAGHVYELSTLTLWSDEWRGRTNHPQACIDAERFIGTFFLTDI